MLSWRRLGAVAYSRGLPRPVLSRTRRGRYADTKRGRRHGPVAVSAPGLSSRPGGPLGTHRPSWTRATLEWPARRPGADPTLVLDGLGDQHGERPPLRQRGHRRELQVAALAAVNRWRACIRDLRYSSSCGSACSSEHGRRGWLRLVVEGMELVLAVEASRTPLSGWVRPGIPGAMTRRASAISTPA